MNVEGNVRFVFVCFLVYFHYLFIGFLKPIQNGCFVLYLLIYLFIYSTLI